MPSTWPVWVIWSSSPSRAIPKSAIANRPWSSSSMFAGLTSRWTMPASCAASSAAAASPSQSSACAWPIGRPEAIRSAIVPPRSSSITMNARPSYSETS